MRNYVLRFVGWLISLAIAYAIGVEGWWLLAWSFTHGAISSTCGWLAVWKCIAEMCSNFPWWIFLISWDN